MANAVENFWNNLKMILYGSLDNSKIAWPYKTAQEKEIILKWEKKKSYIF